MRWQALIWIVSMASMFTFLSVFWWALQRRRERESQLRFEIARRLLDAEKPETDRSALAWLQEQEAAEQQRRRQGLALGGLVLIAAGVGALIALGHLQEHRSSVDVARHRRRHPGASAANRRASYLGPRRAAARCPVRSLSPPAAASLHRHRQRSSDASHSNCAFPSSLFLCLHPFAARSGGSLPPLNPLLDASCSARWALHIPVFRWPSPVRRARLLRAWPADVETASPPPETRFRTASMQTLTPRSDALAATSSSPRRADPPLLPAFPPNLADHGAQLPPQPRIRPISGAARHGSEILHLSRRCGRRRRSLLSAGHHSAQHLRFVCSAAR